MKSEWIDVTKELPEKYKEVLLWFEYYRYGDYNCLFQTYGIGWFGEELWHIDGYGRIKVYAWMPLPEPYEVKND